MMIFEDAAAPFSEDWLSLKMIEENADVKLNIQSVPVSDQATKTQVVFNSGEIPDIVTKTFPKPNDALSGLLLPVSDYVDKLPNFQKYLKDNGLENIWTDREWQTENTICFRLKQKRLRFRIING